MSSKKVNQNFTEKELELLADGLLALMEDYTQAGKLVRDTASHEALENQQEKINALLQKVTGMSKD